MVMHIFSINGGEKVVTASSIEEVRSESDTEDIESVGPYISYEAYEVIREELKC